MAGNGTERIGCVVLGATGMVGQVFVTRLAQHPAFRLEALSASDRRVGEQYGGTVHWLLPSVIPPEAAGMALEEPDPERLSARGVKVAFSALPSKVAAEQEDRFVAAGIHVFSNASAHRMDPDVPILIPEVNAEHLELVRDRRKRHEGHGALVTNANCTVTGMAMGLAPLRGFDIKRVWIASYQALSGAGYPGPSALDMSGNVIPYIAGEEEKVQTECVKILGSCNGGTVESCPMEVEAHCARVAVAHGHLEAISLELGRAVTEEEVRAAFASFAAPAVTRGLPSTPEEAVRITDARDGPQPARDAWVGGGMTVTVGRLKTRNNRLAFKLLVNNIVRGAAGCSVFNAELALREGVLV